MPAQPVAEPEPRKEYLAYQTMDGHNTPSVVITTHPQDNGAIGDVPLNTSFDTPLGPDPGHVDLAKSAMLRNTTARRGGRPRKSESK